jgi:ORF6N domain
MAKNKDTALVPVGHIARSILILRGHRVLLDAHLAALYGITTARLNQQVRRNLERFPGDFMFQLTSQEHTALMLQTATSKPGRGGRRKLPLAFTEHGAIMAATVLNSPRAVEMSIYVVRAFVQLRELLASNKELVKRLDDLEARIARKLGTYDQAITSILKTLRELMNPPEPKKRPIGFTELEERKK